MTIYRLKNQISGRDENCRNFLYQTSSQGIIFSRRNQGGAGPIAHDTADEILDAAFRARHNGAGDRRHSPTQLNRTMDRDLQNQVPTPAISSPTSRPRLIGEV